MRFYAHQHEFYCDIDLYARLLTLCIVDQADNIVLRTQIAADKQLLLKTIAPDWPDLAVAVECLFAGYWVADLCRDEKIPFVLGHLPTLRPSSATCLKGHHDTPAIDRIHFAGERVRGWMSVLPT